MNLKEKVLKRVDEEKIEYVNFQFSDIVGNIKSVLKPADQLEEAIKRGIWFDGSSVYSEFRIQESEGRLRPDLETFTALPINEDKAREARVICDVYVPTKGGKIKPFLGDPRYTLKRQDRIARKMGYIFNVGPEIEFFIFKNMDSSGKPIPYDLAGYFDYSKDCAHQLKKEIVRYAKKTGIPIETIHSEVAFGQHEVDFCYGSVLQSADRVLMLKSIIQTVAGKFDCFVSFMPKPLTGVNGSGMHTHQSLFDISNRKNLFYDPGDHYRLSSLAYSFIAGQIHHARALCAIVAPTVNSYKRLVPGYEAPVNICWARNNRSALIRIPAGEGESTRAELRCPDVSANPYLAFAGMLAAGLDGIKTKIKCPAPVEENVYHLSEKEYDKKCFH